MDRDFSHPFTFDLDHCKPDKTIDIGSNGVSVSADPLGRILQLSAFHPTHGIVVATPFAQFDGSRFREPSYVRAYRRTMLEMVAGGESGYGLCFPDVNSGEVAIDIPSWSTTKIQYQPRSGVAVLCTLVVQDGELVQTVEVANETDVVQTVAYQLRLQVSVNRASYGQLTEGGPIPIPKSENRLEIIEGRYFNVANRFLDAHLEGCFDIDGIAVRLDQLQTQTVENTPVSISIPGEVEVAPGSTMSLVARFRLSPGTKFSGGFTSLQATRPGVQGIQPSSRVWKDPGSTETYLIRRGLDYILGNCAIPVSETDVALMTDHVALPLGWNRDNYWQIRFLTKADLKLRKLVDPCVVDTLRHSIRKVVRGHLSWVFRRAERQQGYWHRSYLVTGKAKDGLLFQLDQQCYPFLELCEYFETYPHDAAFAKSLFEMDVIEIVLKIVLGMVDPVSGLVPTDESPGDDEMDYPFNLSNHILLWHTLSRIRHTMAACQASSSVQERIGPLIDALLEKTMQPQHFLVDRRGKPMLAYVTDGKGNHTFYHDANDVPTVFGMDWALPASYEQAWQNTLKFGFSPENEKGYCPHGKLRGLGSVHSPGPWSLGYFQELWFAHLIGDVERKNDTWRRIVGSMQWDGSFSEAVNPETGKCSSKAWFSWPGAIIGSALIDIKTGE